MTVKSGSVGLRRRPSRRRGTQRVLAVLMVGVLSLALVTPARAQFDWANPASWATVAEMIKVVSTMVSIKRQVENVRNLARSEALGAFAPLVEGLKPVTDSLDEVRGIVTDIENLQIPATFPTPDGGLEPIPATPFNTPMQRCGPDGLVVIDPNEDPDQDSGSVEFNALCMPSAEIVYAPTVADDYETIAMAAVPSYMSASFQPTAPAARAAELRVSLDQRQRRAEHVERKTAHAQSVIDGMMAVVEEYYGCIAVPSSGMLDPNPSRRYCTTNAGQGRGDDVDGVTGTAGLLDDLVAKLEVVGSQPEGNPSQNQLAVLQVRASLYGARARAMLGQVRALELEQQAEDRLLREAAQRRMYEIQNHDLACKADHGVYSHFVVDVTSVPIDGTNPTGSVRGTCSEPPTTMPVLQVGNVNGDPLAIGNTQVNAFRSQDSSRWLVTTGGAEAVGVSAGRSLRGHIEDALRWAWR